MTDQERMVELERMDELDAQLKKLNKEHSEIHARLRAARSPFQVEDVILWEAGSKTRSGKVLAIRTWLGDKFQWKVARIKKDGSLGGQETVRPYHNPSKVQVSK